VHSHAFDLQDLISFLARSRVIWDAVRLEMAHRTAQADRHCARSDDPRAGGWHDRFRARTWGCASRCGARQWPSDPSPLLRSGTSVNGIDRTRPPTGPARSDAGCLLRCSRPAA
jgi:hypothetical protein